MEEQEKVLMGQREIKRWHLMEMVEAGGGSMGSGPAIAVIRAHSLVGGRHGVSEALASPSPVAAGIPALAGDIGPSSVPTGAGPVLPGRTVRAPRVIVGEGDSPAPGRVFPHSPLVPPLR